MPQQENRNAVKQQAVFTGIGLEKVGLIIIGLLVAALLIGTIWAPDTAGKSLDDIEAERYGTPRALTDA